MPYDRFVREMLTASGSNFRVPQVNFYRAVQSREPQAIAQAVALTFMGARAEKWPKERLVGHGGLLLADRLQAHRRMEGGDRLLRSRQGRRTGQPARPSLSGGLPRRDAGASSLADQDPREVFADWLIDAEEPLVRAQHRQPRLVLAAGARHHPRAGRHPAGQSAQQSRAAGLPGAGAGRRPTTT